MRMSPIYGLEMIIQSTYFGPEVILHGVML